MRGLSLAPALVLFCSGAVADWERIGATKGDGAFYVDRSSAASMGQHRKIWVLTDFEMQKESFGNKFRSQKNLYIYDCAARMWAIGMILSYEGALGDGALVDRVHADVPQFIHIVPGSAADGVRKIACDTTLREEK